MPVLRDDFSKIATEFTDLPADTEFLVEIFEITEDKSSGGFDQLVVKTRVVEPTDFEGREVWDFVMLEGKKGPSKAGLGRIKAYTVATLGDDAGNGSEIDTDALIGNHCIVILKPDTYEDKNGKSVTRNKIAKVLPQS